MLYQIINNIISTFNLTFILILTVKQLQTKKIDKKNWKFVYKPYFRNKFRIIIINKLSFLNNFLHDLMFNSSIEKTQVENT